MADDLSDLLPLFASEAQERIERLTELVTVFLEDGDALHQMRRELHALKGASRMIGLRGLAEACHAAEDLLGGELLPSRVAVERVIDALAKDVARMAGGGAPQLDGETISGLLEAEAESGGSESIQPANEDASRATNDLRVPAALLGSLADQSTHLRVAARSLDPLHQRLQELVSVAGEPVADSAAAEQQLGTISASLQVLAEELESASRGLQRSSDRQLNMLLSLQMQPLRPVLQQLARHARELAKSLGKSVTVAVSGGGTRLDRRLVDSLSEAFLHLVRNAVDHGVGDAEARRLAGKPVSGRISIAAASAGGRVTVTVSDDGVGIDSGRVADRAVELGMLDVQRRQSISPRDSLQLLLLPGFTTRTEVTDISGRGVGLDAVAAAVQRIGGDLRVDSTVGKGTAVTIEVPAMRTGERVVIVRSGSSRMGFPAAFVTEYRELDGARIVDRDGRSFVAFEDRLVAFVSLAQLLSQRTAAPGTVLIEGSAGGFPLAVSVDQVEHEEEVLIRPMPPRLSELFDGMTLLASGRPVPILSPTRLVQATGGVSSAAASTGRSVVTPLQILLVDDSTVTREMERRLLEDAGFEVEAVSDAQQALLALAARPFDCLVTDVEMPGMDGLELTRRIRQMSGRANLPVVVVSTRNRPEDRLAGLEAGADGYLAKQGLDPGELVGIIRRVGGGT